MMPHDAATVIFNAATANGISPWVIMTTLEKEQSLVTGQNNGCTDDYRYAKAMGVLSLGPPTSACRTFAYSGTADQRLAQRLQGLTDQVGAGASIWSQRFNGVRAGNYTADNGGANAVPRTVGEVHPLQLIVNGRWI